MKSKMQKVNGKSDTLRSKKRHAYLKKNPWMKSLNNLNKRKTAGIVHFLTGEKLKFMWNRDSAEFFQKAILVRKDLKGNFTLENCKFVEEKGVHR